MDWEELLRKLAVWDKASPIRGYDPAELRLDSYGNFIRFSEYGNRKSKNGWEMDHINPYGGDDISNLQPLQWLCNVRKGNDFFPWLCDYSDFKK